MRNHADGHEESDTRADGYEKQARIDMRNGVRKHLKIGLRDGYRNAENKADREYQPHFFGFGQRRADLVSDGGHRLLCAERKQTHSENDERGADEKAQKKVCFRRDNPQTHHGNYRRNRHYGQRAFSELFGHRAVTEYIRNPFDSITSRD